MILREARADGLDFGGIFALLREQRDAAGNENGGLAARRGERHHHGGQALVAGGDAEDALAGGQRAHEAAQHDGGVVAEGQRVHHAGGALGAAVARIGAGAGKGRGVEGFELARGFSDEQADFPVAGVEAEGDGLAVLGAQAAVGAEDEEFGIEEAVGLPAHTGVLREAEEIAGGLGEEHLRGERQLSRRVRARG